MSKKEIIYITESECLICFDPVLNSQDQVECATCKKIVHLGCFDKWCMRKGKDISICVHCRQKSLLIHRNDSDCFCCCIL